MILWYQIYKKAATFKYIFCTVRDLNQHRRPTTKRKKSSMYMSENTPPRGGSASLPEPYLSQMIPTLPTQPCNWTKQKKTFQMKHQQQRVSLRKTFKSVFILRSLPFKHLYNITLRMIVPAYDREYAVHGLASSLLLCVALQTIQQSASYCLTMG